MIRKYESKDLDQVMQIWLDTNIMAHPFISKIYWTSNFEMVREILPKTEVYVYVVEGDIAGFIGIDDGYIAGIFISSEMQSKGIGKQLLEKAKELYYNLTLTVYQKNMKTIKFYQREHFVIEQVQIDKNTGEIENFMTWGRQK